MCLSLPGKIISIKNDNDLKMAEVDFGGVRRDICIEWVDEAKIGDYVSYIEGWALYAENLGKYEDLLSKYLKIAYERSNP